MHYRVKWLQKVRHYYELIEEERQELAQQEAMASDCKVLQPA